MESATQCTAATLFEGVSIAPNSVFMGPSAALPGVSIEGDSVIYPNCTICSGASIVKCTIAEGCTIGNGASLCEAVCDRHCFLGAGVTVEQGAKLGEYVWVQNGAVILENARVGSGCVIRAGAVVPAHAVIADYTVVHAKLEDPVLISECLQLMEEAHDDLCAVEVELDNYQKLCEVVQLERERDSKQRQQLLQEAQGNNTIARIKRETIQKVCRDTLVENEMINAERLSIRRVRQAMEQERNDARANDELKRNAELRSDRVELVCHLAIMLLMLFICLCLFLVICMTFFDFDGNKFYEYLPIAVRLFKVLCTDVQLWVQDLAGAGYEYFFSGSGLCSDGAMPLVL